MQFIYYILPLLIVVSFTKCSENTTQQNSNLSQSGSTHHEEFRFDTPVRIIHIEQHRFNNRPESIAQLKAIACMTLYTAGILSLIFSAYCLHYSCIAENKNSRLREQAYVDGILHGLFGLVAMGISIPHFYRTRHRMNY
jgi:hypothetical protein